MGMYTGHDPLSWVKQLIGDKDEKKKTWRAPRWLSKPLRGGTEEAPPEKPAEKETGGKAEEPKFFPWYTGGPGGKREPGLLEEVGPGPGDGSDPDGGPSPNPMAASLTGPEGLQGFAALSDAETAELGLKGATGMLAAMTGNPLGVVSSAKGFKGAVDRGQQLANDTMGLLGSDPNFGAEPENATPTIGPASGAAHGPSGHGAGTGKGAGAAASAGSKGAQEGASQGLGSLSVGGGGGSSTGSVSGGNEGNLGVGGPTGAEGPGFGGHGGSSGGGAGAGASAGSGGSSEGAAAGLGAVGIGPSAGAAHGPSGHGAGAGGGGGGGK